MKDNRKWCSTFDQTKFSHKPQIKLSESIQNDVGSISAALSCAGSFPEQRLVIEPRNDAEFSLYVSSRFSKATVKLLP